MELKNLVAVGKVNKTHGVRGLLKVQFNFPLLSFKGWPFKFIFIGREANSLPHFLNSFEELNDGQCIIGLEEIDNRERAMTLTNKELRLPKDIVDKVFNMEEEAEYTGLEGYTLYDQDDHEIGKIEEVMPMPGQELAVVIYKGMETLIPLNENQLIEVNDKLRTVQVNIPEGLLGLNED